MSGRDSGCGIDQKAAPKSAAPTTVTAPKTGKPGIGSKPAIGVEQTSRRKLAQSKNTEKSQGVTARKLTKGHSHSRGSSPWEQRPAKGNAPQQAKLATRIAVPDTRQRGTPNPHQGQKAESTIATQSRSRDSIRAHRIPIAYNSQ